MSVDRWEFQDTIDRGRNRRERLVRLVRQSDRRKLLNHGFSDHSDNFPAWLTSWSTKCFPQQTQAFGNGRLVSLLPLELQGDVAFVAA